MSIPNKFYIFDFEKFDKLIGRYVHDTYWFSEKEKQEMIKEVHDVAFKCISPNNALEVLKAWKDFYLPVNGSNYDWEYYDELERSVIRDLQVNDIRDVIEFGRSQGWWKR
jgi:hypothetical protein